mgnify:CR=1 FL=1
MKPVANRLPKKALGLEPGRVSSTSRLQAFAASARSRIGRFAEIVNPAVQLLFRSGRIFCLSRSLHQPRPRGVGVPPAKKGEIAMNRTLGCLMALGLALGLSFGLAGQAGAVPVSVASAPMTRQAEGLSSALVAEVGYHRGHHRGYSRAFHHRPRGYAYRPRLHHRPVYRQTHYRPVHDRPVRYQPVRYAPVYHRPVRYIPIQAAPLYAAPVYYGGYGYGPECYIKVRKVYTWSGLVRKRVRVCPY